MNNPDQISESLETIFWVKILKFLDADPGSGLPDGKNSDPGSGMEKFGSGMEKFGSKMEKFGSGIRKNIPDPQHCFHMMIVSKFHQY
jgi:hypothetical protein